MKDEPIVAILKFVSCKEHAEEFVSGRFYVNDVKFFRDLEKNTGVRGQGDANELTYNIPHAKFFAIDPKTNEVVFESTVNSSARVFHRSDDFIPLVCFVGIKASELVLVNETEDVYEYKFPFSNDELKKMEAKFGKYCIFISPEALINRLHELNKRFAIKFEPIAYVDESDLSKAIAHFEGKIERFFFKDKDLSYQKEYRLCIYDDMPANHVFEVSPFSEKEAKYFESSFLKVARVFQPKQSETNLKSGE